MPRDDREIEAIRKKDFNLLNDLRRKAETIQGRRIDEVEKRFTDVRQAIEKLVEEKGDILRGPMPKGELVTAAKQAWAKGRQSMVEEVEKHLAICQANSGTPFSYDVVRWIFNAENAWKLFYLIISEKDIESAAASLPDIGLSEKQKEKRITEIDAEIGRLSGMLDES